LKISKTKASVWLARYRGATTKKADGSAATSNLPASVAESVAPVKDNAVKVWDNIEETIRILGCRGTEIKSPEELLQSEKVDPEVWHFHKSSVQRRESPPGYAEIQITLRRKAGEQDLKKLHQALLAEFERAGARKPIVPYDNHGSGFLFVPSIPDVHLGKYSWVAETGAAYDIETAKRAVLRATEDLLAKAAQYKPEKIILPIGNDLFNTDSLDKTTTAGTPQDEVGRWQETFLAGKGLIVTLIEHCREMAPVHVVIVSGNHDTQRAWYLGDTLESYYRQTAGVTVDNAPTTRKYLHWGKVLLGFTHGNENHHEGLPLIMAREQARAWADSNYREWMLGHFHSRRKKFIAADEDQSGVLVRCMPSLCAADYWHSKKGYWSRRAAEGYLYDKNQGLVAEFTHSLTAERI
jgi:hypothetical protein